MILDYFRLNLYAASYLPFTIILSEDNFHEKHIKISVSYMGKNEKSLHLFCYGIKQ